MSEEKKAEKPTDIGKVEGLKIKKSRHYRREILHEDTKVMVTKVLHKPVQGKNGQSEEISATKRKDHKFNPRQNTFFGRTL